MSQRQGPATSLAQLPASQLMLLQVAPWLEYARAGGTHSLSIGPYEPTLNVTSISAAPNTRTHIHVHTHTAQTNLIYATRLSVKRLQWQVNHASQTVVLHLPTGFAHSPVATRVFESTDTKLMNHIVSTSAVSIERCNICG